MTAIPTPPPLSPTESTPVWEDFLDIFYAPTAVFTRRLKEPVVWVPLLVLTVVIAAIGFGGKSLLQPALDAEFARGMANAMKANPQLTPDQMEKGRAFGQTMATVGIVFGAPIAVLFLGPILWLCGKLVGAKEDVGAAWMVATYAYFPRIIGMALLVIQPLVLSPDRIKGFASLSFGPARFLDPDATSKVLLLLGNRLDLFTIWSTIILAIGLKVTGKVTGRQAALATAVVWLIPGLFGLIGALRG